MKTYKECELFKYPYYGKEKLLKKLHRTDGIIFANKLYKLINFDMKVGASSDWVPDN